MKKYVLFGAGEYAVKMIDIIGKENIAYIIDNDINKSGRLLEEIPIFSFEQKKKDCKGYEIIISVSERYGYQIAEQLKKNDISDFKSFRDIYFPYVMKEIKERKDYIEVYNRAINWIKNNTLKNQGIICHSGKMKPYPEVTGYYIPTLIRWGYRQLAVSYADWLMTVQKKDGSWYDTDDVAPYIFDSAQILKGLLAVYDIHKNQIGVKEAIIRGCDWIFSCMKEDGRLVTPSKDCWGEDESICSELIHIYCISPLMEAGKRFQKPEYIEKSKMILQYYKENYKDTIMNFSLLSHFYAYVMEALVDLGETDMAIKAMNNISGYRNENGDVPAYHDVQWVCSTGMFQLALVWYRLGEIDKGNKTFSRACQLQNESGGWYGSYIIDDETCETNDYFPFDEISWCNKYFLDALYYKNKAEFEQSADMFLEHISNIDERYTSVRNVVAKIKNGDNVLDVGCGKGRYLKNLIKDEPEKNYYGIDISSKVLKYIEEREITCEEGTGTCIPYEDNYFSVTYTCEALEHMIDFESAIREMCRVTKSQGYVVIIDKNASQYGALEISEWEQWPDEEQLRAIMINYCNEVEIINDLEYENMENPHLFTAWIGMVK